MEGNCADPEKSWIQTHGSHEGRSILNSRVKRKDSPEGDHWKAPEKNPQIRHEGGQAGTGVLESRQELRRRAQ